MDDILAVSPEEKLTALQQELQQIAPAVQQMLDRFREAEVRVNNVRLWLEDREKLIAHGRTLVLQKDVAGRDAKSYQDRHQAILTEIALLENLLKGADNADPAQPPDVSVQGSQ